MKFFLHVRRISIIFSLTLSFFVCCRPATEEVSISFIFKNNKAVGITLRGIQISEHELASRLKIQLVQPEERVPVLGEFKLDDGEVNFEPLVPFTRNLKYQLLLDNKIIGEIQIPAGEFARPQLVGIYPSNDTLPENLLKMYFEFSTAMVEGRSLKYIALLRDDRDTMKNTFLDLQPELWNADGTVLTLWLDPGRIKRDLIPNKELGAPLKANERYSVHVDSSWQSKDGQSLLKSYSKSFVTKGRDDQSPDISAWKIIAPAAGTKDVLEIRAKDPLDYYLWKETISVKNYKGETVSGVFKVSSTEKVLQFLPDAPWTKGFFTIHVEDRLEDLSGNNLDHVFDRVISSQTNQSRPDHNKRKFEIRGN
jgi:hypothetical protein